MQTFPQFIRAVYAAFCPPVLNLKGGGGAETRRTVARVFAVVFASLFAVQNAAAVGFYLRASGTWYTSSGYADATAAEDAAVEECENDSGSGCRTAFRRGSFENQVFVWRINTVQYGFGRTEADAYSDLVERCAIGDSIDEAACRVSHPLEAIQTAMSHCGDGTAARVSDTCTTRLPVSCSGGDGSSGVCVCPDDLQDDGDGNCGCPSRMQLQSGSTTMCELIPAPCVGGDGSSGVCVCPADFNDDDGDGVCEEDNAVQSSTNTGGGDNAARTESDVADNAIVGLGGAAAVAAAAYYLSGGNFGLFAATPDFGYSITDSGYSVNAGGRVDFHKDRWHLYWTAGQGSVNGDFGDFRYSSGGEYKADIWKAAFSESVNGEVVDYDLSLSADWTGGIWKASPEFAIDSVYEKGEFQTTNSFRINGELLYDDWRFSASGNKTQMELSAVYRF